MAKTLRSLRNAKRMPTHPGEILREDVLPALRMTQTEFAQRLGVSRLTVSEILHEKRPVSVDMAIRLGKLLGNGAGLWLRMQQSLDVWQLEQSGSYEDIEPVEVKAA
jgi:antitoxin HigA-1